MSGLDFGSAMAAEVGEHLPALDNVIEQVVELGDDGLGAGAEHGEAAFDEVGPLGHVLAVGVAGAGGDDPVEVGLEAVDGGPGLAELVHQDAVGGGGGEGAHLLGDAVAEASHGGGVAGCGGQGKGSAGGDEVVGEAGGDGGREEDGEEEGGGVAEGVEEGAEAVEGVEVEVPRGAVVEEEEGGRVEDVVVEEGAVVLEEAGGVAARGVDGAGGVDVVVVMVVEVVDGVGGGGGVGVEGGGAGADEEAGVPQAGGLVHVLVQPPLPRRQVQPPHHLQQLRVHRPHQRRRLLHERRRHEPHFADRQPPVQRLHPLPDRRVEPLHHP